MTNLLYLVIIRWGDEKVESFGKYLKRTREQRKISMRELSRRSGISNAYLSQVENEKRSTPSADIIKKLSTHLNVEYEEMMEQAGYLSRDVPDELQDIGVEWIGLVKDLKEQDISPEYIREIVKLLTRKE